MRPVLLGMTGCGLVVLAGCLKRLEVVAVFPSGASEWITQIEGDRDDVLTGDAMPTASAGWLVEQHTEDDDDGKPTTYLTAHRRLPGGADLPSTYAEPGRAQTIALAFPTEVTLDRRPSGTYYHFRRTYQPRRSAQYGYYPKKAEASDEIKALQERDPQTLSADERQQLTRASLSAERCQAAELATAAALAGDPPLPQVAALRVRQAVMAAYTEDWLLSAVDDLTATGQSDDADLDAQVQALVTRLADTVDQAIRAELAAAEVSAAAAERFLDRLAIVRERHATTEDLGDEIWQVAVVLPGTVVAHNGDRVETDLDDMKKHAADDRNHLFRPVITRLEKATEGDGCQLVRWEFDGDALFDREIVLMASSFVPAP